MPEQLALGNSLVDAGGTAVVGHHARVVQGIVARSESLIAYHLGNCALAAHTHGGGIVRFTRDNRNGVIRTWQLRRRKVTSHRLAFTTFDGATVRLGDTHQRQQGFEERWALLLSPDYDKHWRTYVRRRMASRVIYWANVLNWPKRYKGHLAGIWLMLRYLFARKRS